jgi:hypothetical protein
MWWLVAYVTGLLLSIFIAIPYLRARRIEFYYDEELPIAFGYAVFWPVTVSILLIKILLADLLFGGSVWLFKKSEQFFTPKPPVPKPPKTIDEARSSYRQIHYEEDL